MEPAWLDPYLCGTVDPGACAFQGQQERTCVGVKTPIEQCSRPLFGVCNNCNSTQYIYIYVCMIYIHIYIYIYIYTFHHSIIVYIYLYTSILLNVKYITIIYNRYLFMKEIQLFSRRRMTGSSDEWIKVSKASSTLGSLPCQAWLAGNGSMNVFIYIYVYICVCLVVWNMNFMTLHFIYGMPSFPLICIFQRGWNHQPVYIYIYIEVHQHEATSIYKNISNQK